MSSEESKTGQMYQHVAPSRNPAVALCYESYAQAVKEAEEQNMYPSEVSKLARRVYRKAMPPLSGESNISDFIACVTHGMLLGIFEPEEMTRLLYAAQVAGSAAKRRPAVEEPA